MLSELCRDISLTLKKEEIRFIFQTKPTYSLQNDRNMLVLHETTRTWLFSAIMYTNVGLFPGDILWGAWKYQENQQCLDFSL